MKLIFAQQGMREFMTSLSVTLNKKTSNILFDMIKKIIFIVVLLFSFTSCNKDDVDSIQLFEKLFYSDLDNKLWKHRVNEIDDANKYLESFIGLELDVFYNNNDRFYVSHDDDFDVNLTITFKEYLSGIDNVSDHYYWVDFKNLNGANDENSLKRMLKVMDEFGIKKNTIVESKNHTSLKKYNEKDIYTSYWVPTHFYNGVLSEVNLQDLKEIRQNLSECEHIALSSHSNNLLFLTDHFNEYNLHLWTNGLIGDDAKEIINNLKTYSNVKVILIDYEEPF